MTKDKVQSKGYPKKFFVLVVEKLKDPVKMVTQHTQRQIGETSGVNKKIIRDNIVAPFSIMDKDPTIFKDANEAIMVPLPTMEVDLNCSKGENEVNTQRDRDEQEAWSNATPELSNSNVKTYNSSNEPEFVEVTQVDDPDGIVEENQLSNEDFLKMKKETDMRKILIMILIFWIFN